MSSLPNLAEIQEAVRWTRQLDTAIDNKPRPGGSFRVTRAILTSYYEVHPTLIDEYVNAEYDYVCDTCDAVNTHSLICPKSESEVK